MAWPGVTRSTNAGQAAGPLPAQAIAGSLAAETALPAPIVIKHSRDAPRAGSVIAEAVSAEQGRATGQDSERSGKAIANAVARRNHAGRRSSFMARKAGWEAGEEGGPVRATMAPSTLAQSTVTQSTVTQSTVTQSTLTPSAAAQSHGAEADFSRYLQHLEGLFLELRGRGVQWSPEDSARASRWFRAGLPLASVVGAIEGRVRAFRYLNGQDANLPSHLGWYEPTVTSARGRMRLPGPTMAARLPGPTAEADDDSPAAILLDLLDALPELVEGADDLAVAEACRRGMRSLQRLAEKAVQAIAEPNSGAAETLPGLSESELDAGLRRCRALMVRTVMTGIGPVAAAEIETEIAAQLVAEGRHQGSKKAQQARARVLLERELGRRLGLLLPTVQGWRGADGATIKSGADR